MTQSPLAPTRRPAVFAVTNYFIDHWLPLLGPRSAWLLVALQQACWRGGRRRTTGCISQTRLGRLSGLSREQVNRRLRLPGSYLARFVAGTDLMPPGNGRRHPIKRYRLPRSEPLTPALQSGLDSYLAQAGGSLESAVEQLLGMERPYLLAELERLGDPQARLSGKPTVLAALCRAAGCSPRRVPPDLAGLAEQLSNHILRPDLVLLVGQSFRYNWVPTLGPVLSWLVVLTRRHTYHNPDSGELRAGFGFGKGQLAACLGVSRSTLNRQLAPELDAEGLRPDSRLGHFLTDLRPAYHRLEGRIRAGSVDWLPTLARKQAVDYVQANGQKRTVEAIPSAQPVTEPETACEQQVTDTPLESGQKRTPTKHLISTPKQKGSLQNNHRSQIASTRLLWQRALDDLQLQTTGAFFDSWLRNTWAAGQEGNLLVVGVGHPRAREMLEKRMKRLVRRTLRWQPQGQELDVCFRVLPGPGGGAHE